MSSSVKNSRALKLFFLAWLWQNYTTGAILKISASLDKSLPLENEPWIPFRSSNEREENQPGSSSQIDSYMKKKSKLSLCKSIYFLMIKKIDFGEWIVRPQNNLSLFICLVSVFSFKSDFCLLHCCPAKAIGKN